MNLGSLASPGKAVLKQLLLKSKVVAAIPTSPSNDFTPFNSFLATTTNLFPTSKALLVDLPPYSYFNPMLTRTMDERSSNNGTTAQSDDGSPQTSSSMESGSSFTDNNMTLSPPAVAGDQHYNLIAAAMRANWDEPFHTTNSTLAFVDQGTQGYWEFFLDANTRSSSPAPNFDMFSFLNVDMVESAKPCSNPFATNPFATNPSALPVQRNASGDTAAQSNFVFSPPAIPTAYFEADYRAQMNSGLESPLDSPFTPPLETLCPSDFDTSPAWAPESTPQLEFDFGLFGQQMSGSSLSSPSTSPTTSPTHPTVVIPVESPPLPASPMIKIKPDPDFEEKEVVEEEAEESDEYKPPVRGTRKRKSSTSASAVGGAAPRDSAGKRVFNGTRSTPAPLLDQSAPIQKRNYITSSATSRKAMPKAMERSLRNNRGSFSDRESSLPFPPDQLAAEVEARRAQNTLAARESRKRKADHLAQLESDTASQKEEIARLNTENMGLRLILEQYGWREA